MSERCKLLTRNKIYTKLHNIRILSREFRVTLKTHIPTYDPIPNVPDTAVAMHLYRQPLIDSSFQLNYYKSKTSLLYSIPHKS